MTEATAQVQFAVRPSQLEPYDDHFHPAIPPTSGVHTRHGLPQVALNVVPYEEQVGVKLAFRESWRTEQSLIADWYR